MEAIRDAWGFRPPARNMPLRRFIAMFGLGVLLCALGVALFWPRDAARPIVVPGIAIHYAPAENLERIDVDLLDRAQVEIDIAAYVLTDVAVTNALIRAAAAFSMTIRSLSWRLRPDAEKFALPVRSSRPST